MMKQSTSFAQVATNLLNVLQGYTKGIRFVAVLTMLLTLGAANAWGAEDEIDHEATQSDLNSTATNTWKDFNLTGASGATYIIHSLGTKNTSNALQWNDNGYLYQEKSGGKLKSVTIKGTSGKSVKIYASTTAYTAKASGTAITTLNLTGNDAIYTFAANTNYTYLAINGNASATAITHIIVTYETSSSGDCDVWELVTDASTLKADDEIIITASGDNNYALSTTQANNNRTATSVSKDKNTLVTPSTDVQILTLKAGSISGTWAFYTGSGYLYAASSSGNQLKTQQTNNDNGSFTIAIDGQGVATITSQGTNTRNTMRYNPNNNNPIFACYSSTSTTGSLPSIYKKVCTTQPSYSVTYEANGGTTTCEDNTKYEEGADVMLCGEIPTKENYVFNGWSSDPSVTVTDGKFNMPKSDVTFTAQWSECTGPLITAFNTNGKTDGTYNLDAELGTLSVTAEPSNGGNLIYLWYQYDDATTINQAIPAAGTNNEATYQIPNNEPCIARHYYCIVSEEGCDKKQKSANSGALTLNAIQHTITWSVNGTTQSLSPSSVTGGSNLGTLPTPNLDGICEGKTFVGWTTEANKNYSHETTAPLLITEDTKPTGDVTYYAVFATQEDGAKKTIIFADEWDTNQDLSEHSYFDNAITLSFAKNEGTTAPQYYTSSAAIRLYYDNTMTVTTTTIMQSITFTFVTEDAKGNSISTNPNFGTLSKTPTDQSSESLTHTWNVNTTSVTFTIGKDQNSNASGHCKISQIDVVTADGGAVTYSNYTTSCTTTYTVTYNGNGNTGGTVPTDNNKYEENAQVTVLGNTSNLVKEGYTFAGWNTQSDGNGTDYAAGATFEITKNTTLYAKWEANTYTVCFNANGGIGTMENQSFTYGAEQALSSNKFTRDSYIFAGWATTADGDVVYTDAQSVSNLTTTNGATVTLYAQWSELYTVTFYNMGSVYTTKTQESVGGSITIQETPSACEGYTFDGWSATEVDGVPSYEAVTTITPNEDTQLYAVYSKTEDGGGNATVEDKLTRETTGVSDQTGTTVSYTNWSEKKSQSNAIYKGNSAGNYNSIQLRSDNSTSGVITTTSGGKAKKVTVEWNSNTPNDRTLNIYGKNSAYSAASDLYNHENQGTLLGTIVCGTSTELTIDGDYEYIGLRSAKNAMYLTSITITWATGGPSTTYTTSPDCAEVYNITIDPNIEHGSVTASPMSAVAGTTISLTATPDDTYKFDSWQVTDENSNTIDVTTENTFIMPETDVTVSAIFTEKKRYTITWYANGSEYTTTDVIEDIQIAPPALPNMENYCGVFTGWTTESPVSGNFDETPTLYNEQSEFPLATEETPKTFYAVFADVEGVIPEMPTVIAYWSAKEITTSLLNADEGFGRMTSNIALSTKSSTGKSYYKDLGQNGTTKPVITLSNLNLTTASNICFSFWARGSAQGNLTVKTNLSDEAIATLKLTGKEALYVLENIPTTATSIVITYEVMTGTFFFGTVKFYEAPEIYSFEKLTAENTNGWTGSDWDGYYLITDADTKALDGNAIGEYSNQRVEEVDNKIECSITTAFHIIYNSEKNGYSVQGVGDGDYLQRGNNTIIVSSTAVYLPAISYNSLKGGDNYELQWNGDKCAFYASAQSAPQMYKIMSELSNYRTLCTYDIVLKNNYVDDDSKDGHATITATKTTFNTFTPPTQRPGYTIAGYYAEPECTKKVVEEDQTLITNVDGYTQNGQWIGGNVELYTKWQPSIYNLQSGNFFDWGTCNGGNLTLDGSAIGVKYQLYKDDVKYGEEISGTGGALIWEITESGNYTVKSVDPEMQMNGEAVVQLQDPDIVGENTVEVSKTITLRHPGHRDAAGSWVSSNPEIARVDNGIVTGVAAGTVTITFHGLGNCDAHHEVTVVNPEYTMTWKVGVEDENENIHATTTIISGNPILLPEPPADDALGCCADKFIGWTTSKAQNISKEDVFTTSDEAQTKFPNITEDKTFYAVFATAAQGVGTSIADFSEMGYENATAVTAPIVLGDDEGHGDATITLEKAQSSSNAPTYYTDGEAVRIYAGGTITIASSYHIKKVTFTFATGDGSNEITANSGTYAEGVWTENVESPTNNLTFTINGSTGHRRIASITVTTGVSGSQYTNYVTQCTTLPNPALSGGSVSDIAVDCGDFSTLINSQAIAFSTMQNLTCPVTFEVIEGDFLISTARDRAAQYQSKVKVVPYKTGENRGKLKNVYVRANATDHNETFTGQIKVTSDEITKDVIIDLIATVTCDKFTLTTVDHLGNETVFGTYFAGDVIDTEPTPSSDECTAGYTFAGWSESAVEYGSLVYDQVTFPYTMPNHDVILYPVYRINGTEDYHRVTSDLGAGDVDGNNWAGDYLIAASETTFANGSYGGTTDVNCIGGNNSVVNPGVDLQGNVVKEFWGNQYKVAFVHVVDGYYVLQTQDGKYNYIGNNVSSADLSATESLTTASVNNHPLSIIFDKTNNSVRITNPSNQNGLSLQWMSTSNSFRFGKSNGPIYLYKKSPLYTSYLACGTISVSEEEVYVTATKQRGIMANQPLTVTANKMYPNAQVIVTSNNADVYFSAERNANFAMAAANQPQQSLTLTADEAGELSQSIYIHYRPSSEGDGVPADVEVTAKSHNLPISDNHTIHVRNLPAKFVIATKVGAVWYALPANMTESTNPSGVVIEVDETNMTAIAPTTTTYTLWPVKTTNGTGDRYKEYGERLRFAAVNYEQRGLWANNAQNSATIRNDAVIDELGDGESNAYEWKVTTTVVDGHWKYTLRNDQEKNKKYLCYCTSAEGGAKWGTYESVDNTLYLLPMTEITEMNVEVMEWGTNSMALRFEGDAPANVDITLGGTTKNVPLTNLNSSDIYKVEGVALTTNDGEVLKIVDNTSNNIKLLCKPILVTGESVSTAYSTLETTVCDVVVLNGGKLSAGDAHVDFANIYVYPGGKLILDGRSLGVKRQVYLRGGYSWLNSEYALPELYLNGTIDFNGSGNIIYDYYIQNYKYYQFALPYDVQLAKVTDEAGIDNFPVWVKHYNGALRAVDPHATSWEWYPSENGDAKAYFKAGEGYIIAAQPRQVGNTANRPLSIIRFPLGNKVFNTTNGLESDLSIITKAHGIGGYDEGTVTANNVGWNFVGNPFLSTWQGDIGHKQLIKHPNEANWDGSYTWADSNVKYITIMSAESGSDYAQYIASETELKPFFPFYLQETADGGSGTIDFAAANRMKKAPAVWNVGQEEREAYVQLEIATDAVADQTGVFVGNKYSDDIDFDDYEKMFGTSTELPKLWIMHDDKRMAFEAMTESTAATYIPLGYRAPKIGKYIFAINEEASKVSEVEAVYLTDNQTEVTDFDLLSSAYEFESNGELYNDSRFTIRIVLRDESPGTTTGVGNLLHFNSEQPMKFIYQDKMYILQNGVIYDAMGKQVKTINK